MTAFRDRYGPTALVTGASSGIGAAMARHLAAAGMDLILVARNAGRLEAMAAELSQAHGITARAAPVDVGQGAALMRMLEGVTEEVGLVVAAAGYGTTGPLAASDLATEADMVAVNCTGTLAVARWAAARMRDRGRGGIVLFSSIVGFQGVGGSANYAATKAYVQVLAEGLAQEMRPAGVDVLAVAPGPVATPFADRSGLDTSKGAAPEAVSREALAALGRRVTVTPTRGARVLRRTLGALPRTLRTRMITKALAGAIRN